MALDKIENAGAEVSKTIVPAENLSDHELIEAAKNGDETAFAEIFEKPVDHAPLALERALQEAPAAGLGDDLAVAIGQ